MDGQRPCTTGRGGGQRLRMAGGPARCRDTEEAAGAKPGAGTSSNDFGVTTHYLVCGRAARLSRPFPLPGGRCKRAQHATMTTSTGGPFTKRQTVHYNTISNWVRHGRADVVAGKPSTAYARFTERYRELIDEHCGPDTNRNSEFDRALEILERTCECGNDKMLLEDGTVAEQCRDCQDLDGTSRRGRRWTA